MGWLVLRQNFSETLPQRSRSPEAFETVRLHPFLPILYKLSTRNVRGRAVEAFGLLGRSNLGIESASTDDLTVLTDVEDAFVAERARFAMSTIGSDGHVAVESEAIDDEVGSIDTIRGTTDEIIAEITAPDDDECPNCDLALPENGPPMYPGCGMPY